MIGKNGHVCPLIIQKVGDLWKNYGNKNFQKLKRWKMLPYFYPRINKKKKKKLHFVGCSIIPASRHYSWRFSQFYFFTVLRKSIYTTTNSKKLLKRRGDRWSCRWSCSCSYNTKWRLMKYILISFDIVARNMWSLDPLIPVEMAIEIKHIYGDQRITRLPQRSFKLNSSSLKWVLFYKHLFRNWW